MKFKVGDVVMCVGEVKCILEDSGDMDVDFGDGNTSCVSESCCAPMIDALVKAVEYIRSKTEDDCK